MSRGLYQPLIEDRNVRRLYRLKVWFRDHEGKRVPMTALVNRILDDYFEPHQAASSPRDIPELPSRDRGR